MLILPTTEKLFDIKSIKSKISQEENNLRFHVMNAIIDEKKPYVPTSETQKNQLQFLHEKNILDNPNEIKSIYPVSTKPTNKKVFLKNSHREAFAMCAVDALGMHYTFSEPIRVESECEYSHESIVITVENNVMKVEKCSDDIHVLYKDLNASSCWSCCCCTCIHFFKDSR